MESKTTVAERRSASRAGHPKRSHNPTIIAEQVDSSTAAFSQPDDSSLTPRVRRRRPASRLMMLARRIHLYVGLFLLPWVFLYGITGAMFNHPSLLPRATIQTVPESIVSSSQMSRFPMPNALAAQVVEAINVVADGSHVELAEDPGAEFTNNVLFEVNADGRKHVVHIDPITHASQIFTQPEKDYKPQPILEGVKNVRLEPNPLGVIRDSAKHIFDERGIETSGHPHQIGWSKLNFLATVDGQPAMITYVLNDGHIDVTKFEGRHGMSPREFFMRLHTSHGQSPHWNGRMFWSLFVDAMAIAMVSWGLTGLLMWWQIKRTRLVGGLVMAISITTAAVMYLAMHDFYATTRL